MYFSWRNNYFQRIALAIVKRIWQGKHGNRRSDRRQASRGKVMVTKNPVVPEEVRVRSWIAAEEEASGIR